MFEDRAASTYLSAYNNGTYYSLFDITENSRLKIFATD